MWKYDESNEGTHDGWKRVPLFFDVQRGSARIRWTVKFSNNFHGNISAGKDLYSINCSSCHGEYGPGNGVVGKSLNPPPTDLVSFLGMSMLSDAFLFWSISAGGINFKKCNACIWKSAKREYAKANNYLFETILKKLKQIWKIWNLKKTSTKDVK